MLSKTRLKYIQTLGQKKLRDSEGLFIAEGPKLVEELLKEPAVRAREVLALGSWIEKQQPSPGNLPFTEITVEELERISQLSTPNQVLAILEQFPDNPATAKKGRFTMALDDIRDPGNLGTIIRLADWYGIDTIVCSMATADLYNPKVVQSTMGSIARVSLHYTELRTWLQKQEVPVYAAMLNGRSMYELPELKEGILVVGNESQGIQGPVLEAVDERITIPRIGKAESLNAALATGILLSHLMKGSFSGTE